MNTRAAAGITPFTPLGLALAIAAGPAQAQTETPEAGLDAVVVSGTRTETPVSEIARSITVVDRQAIEEQAAMDRNLSSILANTVPGLAPSTEAVTNFGQTLRGRSFLVLIDGIPQSTPLRDASRDLNTIAPSSIERIEVIRGGTAVYGFGAAGGAVNIITREAADTRFEAKSRVGTRFSTEHFDDSQDYELEQHFSGRQGNWDYVVSGSFVNRGGRFDAEGERIPPDPLGTQGGFADSREYGLLAKTGYDFDGGRQRVEVMVNHLDNEQDSDYTFAQSLEDGRTPALPLSEAPADSRPIADPGTENTTASVSYRHADVLGSSVRAKAYYGDLSVIFPKFPGFKQGEIASEKLGARTTVDTPLPALQQGAKITWGADYLTDETTPERFGGDGRSDTPAMDQSALAGFAELELPVGERALLRGGLRHERISVDTETVAENVNGNTVRGGTLDYDETLFNIGAVFFANDSVDLFASFSQGFSLADLGRVLRDAGSFGAGETLDAEDFESDAEKVDNYEVGVRYYGSRLQASAAVFYSDSDGGATFDDDLRIRKFSEEVWGVEATADYVVSGRWHVGGTASWADGQRRNASGDKTRLDGTRIAPLKLTAYVEHRPREDWRNRLQVMHVGNRDKFDAGSPSDSTGFGLGEVERYTLVSAQSRFSLGPGAMVVSVNNLLNEDYHPAINQAFNIPTAFAKGPGRSVGLAYEIDW
ncbi:TonB-dependent receptor [Arhodomonas sp. SL1]|uniref:TonB-dependent receptor n=1 Tax=Arhodomonas sp. SL1 TaxID=3425691 RepID=UPI003F880AA1